MTTKKIYGPHIDWNGGECPVPPETLVEIRYRNGVVGLAYAADRWWRHDIGSGDIVEYRIVTEQADLDTAEQLLCANGYTVIPPAKPLTFEDVVPMTEAPLKGLQGPLKGARYWVISAAEPDGVCSVQFANDAFDRRIIQRRMAYLDREHALIAARHIFGLKGGEL